MNFLIIYRLLIVLTLAFSLPSESQSVLVQHRQPVSFSDLEGMRLERYYGNPIITWTADTWKGRQVHFPIVIVDPSDPTKLIMFYGGGSVLLQNYAIGRATATVANPYSWSDYSGNPIIPFPTSGNGPVVGPDDVWWNSGSSRFEMHACTYNPALTSSWQGLYYSNDGFTWSYQGVALEPTGDETFLGNGSILRDGSTWYFYYTYRTASAVLPGIRVATSTDSGSTWTKNGDVLSIGSPASSYDGKYIEGLQALKIGDTFCLNYGGSSEISGLVTYSAAYASSASPTSGFVKSSVNPFFTKSVNGWDNTQISTAIFCTATTPWTLFYQGTNTAGAYDQAFWSMGVATLNPN